MDESGWKGMKVDESGRKWIKSMKVIFAVHLCRFLFHNFWTCDINTPIHQYQYTPIHQYCHQRFGTWLLLRFSTWLLAFLISLCCSAVQDCQAVSVLGLEGNWTLEKEEVFERFYGCYFDKYFRNSDPPIPIQQIIDQSVQASLGSDEKVKKFQNKFANNITNIAKRPILQNIAKYFRFHH